jgi:HSP20 family molecular chaperone IbpA
MTSTPSRRGYDSTAAHVKDWLESLSVLRSDDDRAVRVEERVVENRYVVRAELPGLDPATDIEVTVADGVLHIRGERSAEHTDAHHSEFRYGEFSRSVTLPPGAKEDDVTATYHDGILEVSVGLSDEPPTSRRIPVARPY